MLFVVGGLGESVGVWVFVLAVVASVAVVEDELNLGLGQAFDLALVTALVPELRIFPVQSGSFPL